ncbi:P-type cation-transporting ATPase [Drechslerella dactyloides]|uniref:P-type cation-transporting ATPase n=1 Tax=Drechslerella dactyloides TaxID=74499 RepID=A0AAD6IWR5_DREDA|nr:P-type cation-transporting ATPase [Drechslerella dactyloides]
MADSLDSLPSEVSAASSGKSLRYISLGVIGMTCTTCETKLTKAIREVKGIIPRGSKGIRTNFMQGRADLWYDSMIIKNPKEDICATVQRRTGFKCKILRDNGGGQSNRFRHIIRMRVGFPENIEAEAIRTYVMLLKGVDGILDAVEEKPETTLLSKVVDYFCDWRLESDLTYDLEKGEAMYSKLFDIRYDPQTLHVRDLLQYIRSFPRVNLTVDLEELEEPDEIAARDSRKELRSLATSTLLATLLTVPILVIVWTPSIRTTVPAATDMDTRGLATFIALQTLCLLLATGVQLLGLSIYINAYRSLFRLRRLDMDCLITLSTNAAYLYSLVYYGLNIEREAQKLLTGKAPTHADMERHDAIFEASALLITLILAGRLLTGYIKHWATNRISVDSMQEKTCMRSIQGTFSAIRNRRWKTEDVRLLHYGDVLLSQAGETAVTDGVVINGEAIMDESHLTGESAPTQMKRGASIIAGSKVIEGRVEYRATRLIPENTISLMKKLVNTATGSPPKLQALADRVVGWLTPAVLIIAIVALFGWLIYYLAPRSSAGKHQNLDTEAAASKAITVAITILAISCPCAIALAVPTVLIFSTQVGVKNGIVIKSPASLEKGTGIMHFVADKTGTLTTGKLQVAAAKYWIQDRWVDDSNDKDVQEVQNLIYRLVARDHHPVAKAVSDKLKERHNEERSLPDEDKRIRSIVGKGIEGFIGNLHLRGGKPSWVLKEGLKNFDKSVYHDIIEDVARTPFVVVDAKKDIIVAIFGLSDTIRPEAAQVIAKLQELNIQCHMLSGDQIAVCRRVAEMIGIHPANVYGECSPEEKSLRIQVLQTKAEGDQAILRQCGWRFTRFLRRFRTPHQYVLFLGDGTNDAAALTQADIGVTMSNCTDIAAGCADAGIISSSLTGVLALLTLSKRAMTLIKYNFAWAIIYNFGAILIAAGITGWSIPPQYAGIGEAVSVAPVFIIASIILWCKLRY